MNRQHAATALLAVCLLCLLVLAAGYARQRQQLADQADEAWTTEVVRQMTVLAEQFGQKVVALVEADLELSRPALIDGGEKAGR